MSTTALRVIAFITVLGWISWVVRLCCEATSKGFTGLVMLQIALASFVLFVLLGAIIFRGLSKNSTK